MSLFADGELLAASAILPGWRPGRRTREARAGEIECKIIPEHHRDRPKNRSKFSVARRAFGLPRRPTTRFRQNAWESGAQNWVPKYAWVAGTLSPGSLIGPFLACSRKGMRFREGKPLRWWIESDENSGSLRKPVTSAGGFRFYRVTDNKSKQDRTTASSVRSGVHQHRRRSGNFDVLGSQAGARLQESKSNVSHDSACRSTKAPSGDSRHEGGSHGTGVCAGGFAPGNLLPQPFAMADEAGHRPGITVTNTVPEFTLTLPDRYFQLKSTGNALCNFGTKDRTAGALVGVYPLGHTIEPGIVGAPQVQDPDSRQIPATWKTFSINVTAWHPAPRNGTRSAALSAQIPLKQQAVSILVLVPVEKEAFAEGLLQDFLTGLDGPSNWRVERPLTATERAMRLALGLGLMVVLLAGPPLGLRAWQRHVARQMESNSTTALRLRNFAATMATPALANPRYWLRVFAVVGAVIAAVLAYLSLAAADVSLIFNRTLVESFKAVSLLVEFGCLLVLLLTLGFWISSFRRRGRVLLDFGPDRMRALFLAVGILCFVAAITCGAAAVVNSGVPWSMALLAPLQLVIAVQFLVRVTGRVQITEYGIWENWSLLRWERIGCYRWVGDSTLLAVKGEGPVSLKLPVPPEHLRAVEQILARHGLIETGA